MKNLCTKCIDRKICTTLCVRAENYVNQDYIPQSELLVSDPTIIGIDEPWGLNLDNKNIVKDVVLKLVSDGKTTREIAYHVPISKRHIRRLKQTI